MYRLFYWYEVFLKENKMPTGLSPVFIGYILITLIVRISFEATVVYYWITSYLVFLWTIICHRHHSMVSCRSPLLAPTAPVTDFSFVPSYLVLLISSVSFKRFLHLFLYWHFSGSELQKNETYWFQRHKFTRK